MSGNLYDILGVNKNATKNQIKKAYHRMALKYHPDKNKEGLEMFKKISQSYQILSDPILKKKYDKGIKININLTNPYDILDLFYKEFFSNAQIIKIKKYLTENIKKLNLKDDLSIDLLYSIILDFLYKKNFKESVNDDETIYIDVTYNLRDHFELEFYKNVFVEIKNKDKKKKLIYNIDTRRKKYFFKENIFNKIININLNVTGITDNNIIIIDNYNILKIIKINIDQYLNGFYYKFNLFDSIIYLYFKDPVQSNLIYKLHNKGVPISELERGNIYFQLQLTKEKTELYSFIENQEVNYPEIINFF